MASSSARPCCGLGTHRKSISSLVAGGVQSTNWRGLLGSRRRSTAYRRALLKTIRFRVSVVSAATLPSISRAMASSPRRTFSESSNWPRGMDFLVTQAKAEVISSGGSARCSEKLNAQQESARRRTFRSGFPRRSVTSASVSVARASARVARFFADERVHFASAYSLAWANHDTWFSFRNSDAGRPVSVSNCSPLRMAVSSSARRPSASGKVAKVAEWGFFPTRQRSWCGRRPRPRSRMAWIWTS